MDGRLLEKILKMVILLTCTTLYAQALQKGVPSPEKHFANANELYKKGDYSKALEEYKKIENKSAATYYNLGNCAYKLQQYGWALLYWRRAEQRWSFFNREELIENISLLKEEVAINQGIRTKKRGLIMRAFAKIKHLILSWLQATPLLALQLLFLLLWLFVFIYLRFLYKRRRKGTIVALFALIAFFGILLVMRASIASRTYGVVVGKQARLLSGPGETFQNLRNIPEATEVIIKQKGRPSTDNDEYLKVKALRQLGWIKKDNVEKVVD